MAFTDQRVSRVPVLCNSDKASAYVPQLLQDTGSWTSTKCQPRKLSAAPNRLARLSVKPVVLGFEIAEHLPPEEQWTRYFGMPLPLAVPSMVD